jgi:gluconokinase
VNEALQQEGRQEPPAITAIVVMGVSGSGKSTVGAPLAARLNWRFADGDDFHPMANVRKMAAGIPLDDQDRLPWLKTLNVMLRDAGAANQSVVLACSALRQSYRDTLSDGLPGLRFVHLSGSIDVIAQRLNSRVHRYMPPSLLVSQFTTLEPPLDALTLDVGAPVGTLVQAIIDGFGLGPR